MQSQAMIKNIAGCRAFDFQIISPEKEEYEHVQRAIARKYHKVYEADVQPTPDMFAVLKKAPLLGDGIFGACFGITSAIVSLFSEQYLTAPLQQIIHQQLGRMVARSDIAEVGSVVASGVPNSGKDLLEMMPGLLWSMGFEVVLITATKQIRSVLEATNIPFRPIASARPEKLKSHQTDWGSYYDNDPVTGVIDIKAAILSTLFAHFSKKFAVERFDIGPSAYVQEGFLK